MQEPLTKEEAWVLNEKYGGLVSPHFEADRARLAAGEPVAYIIGWQPFLGLAIHLDSRPLIPRPETEWWVNELLTHVGRQTSNMSNVRFLDLCAGSGAIGCAALKTLPQAEVYFGELDPVHEATIRKNIETNRLDIARTHIGIGDLFAPLGDQVFDIIAANPPYIPADRELPASVSRYEPAGALYAGPDGLHLIRHIAAELPARLRPGGEAWIECDAAHAEHARDLFSREGFSVELLADQYGAPRVIQIAAAS